MTKTIRREISEIVGVLIPESGWDATFRDLERAGRLSQKVLTAILLVILKRLEIYESK